MPPYRVRGLPRIEVRGKLIKSGMTVATSPVFPRLAGEGCSVFEKFMIFDLLKTGRHERKPKGRESIPSENEFRALLEYERARVDRNGREFSLIVFVAGERSDSDREPSSLARLLCKKMRSTDVLGWFDRDHIGIFLPDTPADAAARLARDRLAPVFPDGFSFQYRIYHYPSFWPDAGPQPEDENPGKRSGEIKTETSENCSCLLQVYFASRIPHWKRILDISGAALAVFVLFPLLVLIGALIRIVSPGPVLFRQERLGYAGNPFICLKFRTMKAESGCSVHEDHLAELIKNSNIPMRKLDSHDTRIIPLGRFLRKTGLDELPQLVNVLRGEMSLIGPRPCLPNEASGYLIWHRRRLDIHPGLTGLWQVNGKNRTTFNQMIRFDLAYIDSRSFLVDMKILLKTMPAIVGQAFEKPDGRGVSCENA